MAADERATITIDVDVKNLNRLQEVTAALEEMGIASEVNAAKFSQLTGAMTGHSKASKAASKDSQKLYEKISALDKVSMAFTKQARKLMLGMVAMGLEFGVSALALASVNAAFVIGKVLVKGYHLAMQGLSAGLAAVGVAAIAAAAAFSEFQTAQFAFRYSSDDVTTSMDKSSLALRGLYKDTQLNIYGMKALSAAFAGISKNSKFTPQSQEMLRGFSDFIASSGDSAKSMQATANFIGLVQKKQTGYLKNSKYMSAEAVAALKQINPALADMAKNAGIGGTGGGFGTKEKFIEALLDGSLAQKAGVAGAADNIAGTLFSQFKSYLTSGLVELSDVGKRVLEPVKEAMHEIFTGLIKTFRRVDSNLVAFGQGPFLKTIVSLVNKLENFSVVLFRKYLPTTEGFGKKLGALFFQLKSWFSQVTTSLNSMRDGGSIVIKTFGGPILEIFKQIGNSARNIADLATSNREKFLKFGEALKGIVVGFFDLSRTFKEAFTGALPVITTVLNALSKVASAVAKVFGYFTGPGNPLASAVGMFAMGSMAIKGTRAAQRKNRGKTGNGIPGYNEISELDWAARGLPMPSIASGAATTAGGGTSLSGAMDLAGQAASTALTTGLAPGISSVSSASSAAAGALTALTTAATGASIRGKFTGGRVDNSGQIIKRPSRKPGQTTEQYRADIAQWYKGVTGEDSLAMAHTQGNRTRGAFLREKYGSAGPVDRRPIFERGNPSNPTAARTHGDMYARLNWEKRTGGGVPDVEGGKKKAREIAVQRTWAGFEPELSARDTWNSSQLLNSDAERRMTPRQKIMSRLRSAGKTYTKKIKATENKLDYLNNKTIPQFINGSRGSSGVLGAMPGGGTTGASAAGGGSRVINPGPGSIKDIGLRGKIEHYGGKALFGQGYQGGTFASETKNLLTGKNFRARYQASLNNQQAALAKMYPDAAKAGVQLKGSRLKAIKAASKANFSGLGGIGAMGLSAAAGRFGSEESQGAMQMGAGLMTQNPLLGIGVAGLGTAMSAKTKTGGLVSGAAGGAAIGMMVGGPLGAAAGALLGATFGFFKAKANQGKMVKNAVKKIGMAQVAGVAAKAVEGALIGTTNLARKKMLESSKLADAFRGAKTEAERKKVLEQYSTGPNAILSGNAASLAVGDKFETTQKQLDQNVKDQKELNPLLNHFDKVMKALKGTTSMTAAEIFDLAMRKNVNLYDSTQSLSEITAKLGTGMVKTAQQMRDALKDIRIGAQGVYEEYKRGKDLKDSLQGAGNTLRGGNNSAEAMGDYLNKFGDYLDYKNPNSPVSNVVATLKAFGSGAAFGTGLYFQKDNVLSGVTQKPEDQKLGNEYTTQMKLGTASEMANQLGAQLLANNVQGVDPDMLRKQIAGRTANLMDTVSAGNAAGATDQQKTAAREAETRLKALENMVMNPTVLQGKDAGQLTTLINDALYGKDSKFQIGQGKFALENVAKEIIEVKVDRTQLQSDFLAAVNQGFSQSKDAPQWWNQAPDWWNNTPGAGGTGRKWNQALNDGAGGWEDTRTPRRGRVGDTGTPRALGATMSAHNSMNSMLTGKRSVTSSFRTTGLGSPSSDHKAGRAYDLTGQNLGQYASLAKSAGGFAEFHGAASSRHLHVVPSLGRSGDTSTPVGSVMSPSGTTYNGGDISITIVESKDAKATAKEVAKEIIAMQKNERRRI
jgi:hypothetical protein